MINCFFWLFFRFHILTDFDEGKRSCRRKLERHNKRRRRRPTDLINIVEEDKEHQGDISVDDNCAGKPRKGTTWITQVSSAITSAHIEITE